MPRCTAANSIVGSYCKLNLFIKLIGLHINITIGRSLHGIPAQDLNIDFLRHRLLIAGIRAIDQSYGGGKIPWTCHLCFALEGDFKVTK